MNDETVRQRNRARFSLLTTFLVTAMVALSITIVMLYREVKPLRDEVRRLRNEVGELNIEDPMKFHAIRVETANELEWKWRIWVPKGVSYRLRANGGPVPKEGYPNGGGTLNLREPGEHVVRYLIRRDPRDGRWKGSLHTQTAWVGTDHQPWVEWSSRTSAGGGVGTSTQSYETERQVEIIRHRVSEKTSSSAQIEDPAAGFMIWLEPN